jgi:hypothetical protein
VYDSHFQSMYFKLADAGETPTVSWLKYTSAEIQSAAQYASDGSLGLELDYHLGTCQLARVKRFCEKIESEYDRIPNVILKLRIVLNSSPTMEYTTCNASWNMVRDATVQVSIKYVEPTIVTAAPSPRSPYEGTLSQVEHTQTKLADVQIHASEGTPSSAWEQYTEDKTYALHTYKTFSETETADILSKFGKTTVFAGTIPRELCADLGAYDIILAPGHVLI